MKLSFHRSQTMSMQIQTTPGESRAFVFDVVLGLGRTNEPVVDPDSGMLLNLAIVDSLLNQLRQHWHSRTWNSLSLLLSESLKFLLPLLVQEEVFLEELVLREKRGFALGWKGSTFRELEEIRELDSVLFQFVSRWHLRGEEFLANPLNVHSKKSLESERVFAENPDLIEIEVSDLTHQQKRLLRKK